MQLVRARRMDVGTLASPVRRADGTAVFDGKVARTGVLVYNFPDGSTRREYVPPSTLFDPKSMATLKLRPVTSEHPGVGLLDSRTARGYAVGAVGDNVRPLDKTWLGANLGVHDADALSRVDAGDNELSCGYECDLDLTPGTTPEGEPFDATQLNREYNHLAITRAARAGSGAAIRMDSAGDNTCGVANMADQYDAALSAEQRNSIPQNAKHFAIPEREGLPIEDPAHVKDAMARFNQEHFASASEKKAAYHRIVARAHELGIDPSGFVAAHGEDAMNEACGGDYNLPADQRNEDAATKARRGSMDNSCLPSGSDMQGSGHMANESKNDANTGATGTPAAAPPAGMTAEQALASLNTQLAQAISRANQAEAQAASEKLRADALVGKEIELRKDLDAVKAKLTAGHTAMETAAIIKERERADTAETALTNLKAGYEKRVRERASLETRAASVLGVGYRFEKLDDRDVMAVAVKQMDPSADISSGVAEGVIRGRFDSMLERRESTARDIARTAAVETGVKHADAATDYTSKQRERGMKPLPSNALKH